METKEYKLESLRRYIYKRNFNYVPGGMELEDAILDKYNAITLSDLSAGQLINELGIVESVGPAQYIANVRKDLSLTMRRA